MTVLMAWMPRTVMGVAAFVWTNFLLTGQAVCTDPCVRDCCGFAIPPRKNNRPTQLTSVQEHVVPSAKDDVPTTPCVRICRYNKNFYDGAVCIGCFREAYEISQWERSTSFGLVEKFYALQDALDRWEGDKFQGSISREALQAQIDALASKLQ